jgi:hypothetical protein
LQGAEIGKDFYILDVEEELEQEHRKAALLKDSLFQKQDQVFLNQLP